MERQKHIKIADRSDNGWATVEEYVEDELADNSDDEKRLSRADARASKKLKSAAQKNTRFFKKPGPSYRKSYASSFYSPRSSPFYPTSATMYGQAAHLPGSAAYHVPAAAKFTQLKPGQS